jgi:hypothetical protein
VRFTQRLLEQIGLPPNADLIPDRPPFELDVADRRLEWTEVEAPSGRNGGFSGGFTAEGLRAELHARGFEGSSAIELAGTVRNEGSTTFSVTAASTLYLKVRVADDWDDPVVRSWAGAPLAYPIFFPPDDYRPIDRQLVSMPFIWTPLWIKGSPTGFSSHESLPFAIVAGKGRGVAIGVEWSGTWYLAAQPDSGQTADRHLNLELDVGVWSIPLQLRPGDALPLANVLLVPYQGNATAGGNALRRHIRNHVVPRLDGKEVAPPTSFNTGFALGWADNISDSLLRPAVDAAAEVGIEYFVVDAGWHEGGCPLGTGNWEEINRANFPDGLEPFSAYVQSKGMQYGMWFDPETAEAASGMFRRHPDWFFPKPAPGPTTFTHRRVMKHVELMADAAEADRRMLDFGLPEVQQWWIDYLTAAYERWGLRWIRWDFTDDAPFLHWQAAEEPGWA